MEKDLKEEKQKMMFGSIQFWGKAAAQRMASETAPPLLVLWGALSVLAQSESVSRNLSVIWCMLQLEILGAENMRSCWTGHIG